MLKFNFCFITTDYSTIFGKNFKLIDVMKTRELKTLWKVATRFWIAGFVFWIVETVIFLIIEGWHLKATNQIEIYCDEVFRLMWKFALQLTLVTCVYWLIKITKINK